MKAQCSTHHVDDSDTESPSDVAVGYGVVTLGAAPVRTLSGDEWRTSSVRWQRGSEAVRVCTLVDLVGL